MPQFFVPRKNLRGNFFVFPPSESRHLTKVLRKKSGDIIQIFDGQGLVVNAEITDISNSKAVQAKLLPNSFPHSPNSPFLKGGSDARGARPVAEGRGIEKGGGVFPKIHLYPALIRNERFEWMLEKVTELGVTSIHPILTERTIVHLPENRISAKLKRWEKIVLSAAKQCGRNTLPEIVPPLNFNDSIRKCQNDSINLILWEGEEENNLNQFLATTRIPLTTFNLFIGPEGGFTLEEVELAKKSGFQSVRLKENILRAETAALSAVSLILLR